MDKRIIVALIGVLAAILGGGSFITYTNTVTNITGDTITDITTNLNIDLAEIKEICRTEDIPTKYQAACDLLEGLP